MEDQKQEINKGRRDFLKIGGTAALTLPFTSFAHFASNKVALVSDGSDLVANSKPALWAAQYFEQALVNAGLSVKKYSKAEDAKDNDLTIVITGPVSNVGSPLIKNAGTAVQQKAESLAIIPLKTSAGETLVAYGFDERGLVYALLELADRVQHSNAPLSALKFDRAVIEAPANEIRSLNRLFVSDVEDKPWYNDKEMWPQYLTMMATQRFNRFNLSFGIGYDFLQRVTDAYFLFAYPFLFDVPGYNVNVPELSNEERDANLAMLQYISSETVARGLQFQLGLWMHGYEWLNTTNANYNIKGLNKENHAAYCRDAVRLLLQKCPAISGITFRVHGESGVNEGSYNFWSTIFDGVKTCGRKVEIDMHAKGLDESMINAAVSTGMPVVLSPKYWAEHMGMPYHQADIRALEIPNANHKASELMNLSAGSRSFLRYGYGDLMKEDRPYKILHRIWPGTQRLLLWGDPVTAAAHARAFSFCGSNGVELMEPLSFKGRRGSGLKGDRCGYADNAYKPRWDWEKYLYTLRIFGRLTYDPATAPDVWQRFLKKQFNDGAGSAEVAIGNVSRILPIVLTAHGASAGNNMYWPEMYTNQPVTDASVKNTYTDTPAPKTFGNVTPLDPQLFLSINDFTKEYLSGERSGKYTPLEVAQWLEDYASAGEKSLSDAVAKSSGKKKAEFRRMATDVAMQVGLGKFFGAKFRAGILYAVYDQTGDKKALEAALKMYKQARAYWAGLSSIAKDVYAPDVTVGEHPWLRGHWLDRIPAIDADVENMEKILAGANGNQTSNNRSSEAIKEALGNNRRAIAATRHSQPATFLKGQPLKLEFSFDNTPGSAVLFYRHVNQAERFQAANLSINGNKGEAVIPADYTGKPYPVEYYLEIRSSKDNAWLFPGFNADLASQPYYSLQHT